MVENKGGGGHGAPKPYEDSPETLLFPGNAEIDHCVDLVVDRNAHPLVCPFERVRVESLIISGTFLAPPAIDLRHDFAHGTIVERGANVIHTLPPVLDTIPPGLHDLVTRWSARVNGKRGRGGYIASPASKNGVMVAWGRKCGSRQFLHWRANPHTRYPLEASKLLAITNHWRQWSGTRHCVDTMGK